MGNTDDDFFLRVRHGSDYFFICNSDVNYQIEIIKTEEVPDNSEFQTALKVWIKVEDMNLDECNTRLR